MPRLNDKTREAYELALKRTNIDIVKGQVWWGKRPRQDFTSARYHAKWTTQYAGTLVGYKNGTRSGPGFKFNGCNLSVARLIARKRWGPSAYDFYMGYRDGNNLNLHSTNLYLIDWSERKLKYNKKLNKTGFVGVHKRGDKYVTLRSVNGKRGYYGSWDTPEEAHAAYLGAK